MRYLFAHLCPTGLKNHSIKSKSLLSKNGGIYVSPWMTYFQWVQMSDFSWSPPQDINLTSKTSIYSVYRIERWNITVQKRLKNPKITIFWKRVKTSFLRLIINTKRMTIFIPYKIYLRHFLIQATFYKWKMQKSLFDEISKKWFLHFSLIKSCLDQNLLKINLVGNKNRHSFCIYDEPQKWCLDPFSKNGYFWIF